MNWIAVVVVPLAFYVVAEVVCHMYVDFFEKSLPRKLAWFFWPASRIWEPGDCSCKHCGISDRLQEFHVTYYRPTGCEGGYWYQTLFPDYQPMVAGGNTGIFVLCEHCWSKLTPQARWVYYKDFLSDYPRSRRDELAVYRAVMAGK